MCFLLHHLHALIFLLYPCLFRLNLLPASSVGSGCIYGITKLVVKTLLKITLKEYFTT